MCVERQRMITKESHLLKGTGASMSEWQKSETRQWKFRAWPQTTWKARPGVLPLGSRRGKGSLWGELCFLNWSCILLRSVAASSGEKDIVPQAKGYLGIMIPGQQQLATRGRKGAYQQGSKEPVQGEVLCLKNSSDQICTLMIAGLSHLVPDLMAWWLWPLNFKRKKHRSALP